MTFNERFRWRMRPGERIRFTRRKKFCSNAEPKFPKEGIIKYNLACYSCQTGDIETAKKYLKKAFEIDSSWRLNALNDEDLKPMWDSL